MVETFLISLYVELVNPFDKHCLMSSIVKAWKIKFTTSTKQLNCIVDNNFWNFQCEIVCHRWPWTKWKGYMRWKSLDYKKLGEKWMVSYLVGTTSPLSITNSHDVILIGHAMWPKLSRTRASQDEYGVCESLCNRSERCKRARRFGVVPPELGDVDGLKRSI